MQKATWFNALFQELNRSPESAPSSSKPSAPPTRLNDRPHPSTPPRCHPHNACNDNALAAYASSQLYIRDANGSPSGQSPSMPQWSSNYQGKRNTQPPESKGSVQWPSSPADSTQLATQLQQNTPSPTRKPLYSQEVPFPDQSSYYPGGFVEPRATQVHLHGESSSTPSSRPFSNATHPPHNTNSRPTSLQTPPPHRGHAYSTPPRPTSLQASRPVFIRPAHSTPGSFAPTPSSSVNKTSQSASPSKSNRPAIATTPSESKPNQCHGTKADGKRCTRIVGGAAKSKKKDGHASPIKAEARKTGPDIPNSAIDELYGASSAHTFDALSKLDRRLSISRQRHRTFIPRRDGTGSRPRKSPLSANEEDEEFEDEYARLESHNRRTHDVANMESTHQVYEELPVYCFQHAKQTLAQQGVFVGEYYVEFDSWIPTYLPGETQLQLRHEISKPVSSDDIPGYIYVHEMANSGINESSTTFIKLGRSVKPVARLSQWRSQCRSREPIVRNIFPLHPSHPLHHQHISSSTPSGMLNGALAFAEQGAPNHHRWERLCLIELAGVAANQSLQRGDKGESREKCSDCGKIHVELFLLDRGSYITDVREIVLRWQRFVETTSAGF